MVSGPPKGGVDLSFDSIHEGWSIYKTKDGALIKVRQIPLRITLVEVKEDGTGMISAGGSLFFAVTAPPELKGPPNDQQITQEQINAAIVEREVPFDIVREDWSEYNAEGVKIALRVVITIVAKTSLFDATGEPVYSVNYQMMVRPIISAEDRARFKKIWEERAPKKATPLGA
jgi:hypothetical protein